MPRVIFLEHKTVKGINSEWEEVTNFPIGRGKLVWNPDHQCLCGNVHFAITHGWRVTEEGIDGGVVFENRTEICRIVCPFCIDFMKEERIVGELDFLNMAVTMYDLPRPLTEEERRPGRWRKDGPGRERIPEKTERQACKHISGEDYLDFRRMMDDERRRKEEYDAALARYERSQLTKPFRRHVKRALEKPAPFEGIE